MDAPELHRDAVVVDCHNDQPIQLLMRQRALGELGNRDYFREHWIPEFRAGGVDVQVLPVYLEPARAEASLRASLLMIEALRVEVERNGDDLALCRSGAELDAARTAGKVAIVVALEGCAQIGTDLPLFSTFAQLGVRIASFTHFGRTALADGSAEDEAGSRLTAAGVAAVGELERLGILLDVSHLSAVGVDHVLELATRPLIASHSCARELVDHHRNLRDEHVRAIAATGGVACVTFVPRFVDECEPTIDRVIDHVERFVELAGAEHVGFGSDFLREYVDELYPQFDRVPFEGLDMKATIPGLAKTSDLPRLTERMLERGFAEDDVRGFLGGNLARVFRQGFG